MEDREYKKPGKKKDDNFTVRARNFYWQCGVALGEGGNGNIFLEGGRSNDYLDQSNPPYVNNRESLKEKDPRWQVIKKNTSYSATRENNINKLFKKKLPSFYNEDIADCRELNLKGLNLSGFDFSQTNCRGVIFNEANLKNVKFLNTELEGADFSFAENLDPRKLAKGKFKDIASDDEENTMKIKEAIKIKTEKLLIESLIKSINSIFIKVELNGNKEEIKDDINKNITEIILESTCNSAIEKKINKIKDKLRYKV